MSEIVMQQTLTHGCLNEVWPKRETQVQKPRIKCEGSKIPSWQALRRAIGRSWLGYWVRYKCIMGEYEKCENIVAKETLGKYMKDHPW